MNQYWTIPGDNALHESTGTHGAQSEQNPLVKLDPGLFIWTVLTFVLLLTVLAKFAWKPLLLMLDERNKSIEESLLSAEKARKELENINQESESILMKAKTEAQSIVGEAKSAADNMKEDIVSKARSEAEGQLEKAKIQINVEKR
jgi:F-type H+-transporting ATPase subunit b